jgi:site-specific recombinase XerC
MDRKRLEIIETGIKRDPVTKQLMSETKVKVGGTFEKIYRDWPAGKDAFNAARVWRTIIKDQHKRKHQTLKLRSNGTWLVRLPATSKYRPVEKDFGYDFSSANDWGRTSFDERSKGKWSDERATLESVWNCYLSHPSALPADTTMHSYTQIWKNQLLSHWGSTLVSDIGPKLVQKWIDGWTDSIPKLEKAHSVLSVILSHAVDEELLQFNPAFRRKLPKRAKPVSPAIPLDKYLGLLNHPKRESDRIALALATQTTLRISEWSALRVKDFNHFKRLLTVTQHMTRTRSGKATLSAGSKTSKDAKTTSVSVELADRILKFIEDSALNHDDLLFPSPKGSHWSYNNFRSRVWEPARIAAGVEKVPYMTGTHSTKRAGITIAHEGGLSAATIRGQTKHAGTRIIQDTYLQTADDAERVVADVIQKSLRLPD